MEGAVNRDRQRLSHPGEEAKILAKIWEVAIRELTGAVSDYVDMLLDEIQWRDVNRAESEISASTASLIWQYLLQRDSGKDYFYHGQDVADQDAQLIRKSLKKIPIQLPTSIWKPLRRFNLARTVQEERCHLLYNATLSTEADTLYSAGVKRALMATLFVDTKTQNLEIVFKSGSSAELDLLLEDSLLQVNEKWLDFRASHKDAPCGLSHLALTQDLVIHTFSCDHVINELYDLVLVEINKERDKEPGVLKETDNSLRLRVSESLRQMPRMIDIIHGENDGEILVSWTDSESYLLSKLHHLDLKCRVTLHRESTCSQKRFDLVGPTDLSESEILLSGSEPNINSDCGCPEKVVLQKDSRASFDNLEHDDYFPMIARTHPQAFYGLPPKALQPAHLQITHPTSSTGNSSSISATSPSRNNHNHACYISDTGDLESDPSFGDAILEDSSIDTDSITWHRSKSSELTGAELLGLRNNEHTSSFSRAKRQHTSSPDVEALPENIECAKEQLQMSKWKDETRHRRTDYFIEVLMEKDKLIQDAKATIEQLEIWDQDANGSIENLRIKIQQLRDENTRLATDRDQAQDDCSKALSLAHNAVTRYGHSETSSKRDWARLDYASSSPERSTKYPRVADVS